MNKEKLFQVGVKALIENEKGEILLVYTGQRPAQYNSDFWDIPGGRIDENENALQTLAREIKEETGLEKIEDVEFVQGVISNHEFDQNGLHFGLVLMVYKVQVAGDSEISLSSEHEKFEWVDKKEAAQRLSIKYPPEFTSLLV